MAITYSLTGKVALVTGGARGIGQATARALVARGASVAIVDLDEVAAQAAATELGGDHAIGIGADVTDRSAMQRAVARTVERFGGVDVVVANAGIAHRTTTFRSVPNEAFDRVIDVNLLGVARTVDAALPQIVERQGHVVVIASVYAFVNGMGNVAYAMAKAGVEQLGRALRAELVPHGASATVAYFGFIDTPLVHKALDADPLAETMIGTLPKPLQKRLAPEVAGEAIVEAIEKRAPRVIRPRRWAALSVLRGILNPLLDRYMERDEATQKVVRALDEREGEESPTTA